jgi:hypothetical protein
MFLATLEVFSPWFPNERLDGVTLTAGAVPVPLKQPPQVSGLLGLLEFTVSDPENAVADVGLNVT